LSAVEAVHHPLRLHIVAVRDWVLDFRSVHDLDARTIHTQAKATVKGDKKPFLGPENSKKICTKSKSVVQKQWSIETTL